MASAPWGFTPALRSPRPLSAQAPPSSSYCFPGPSSKPATRLTQHVPRLLRARGGPLPRATRLTQHVPCLLRARGGPLPRATRLTQHVPRLLRARGGPLPRGPQSPCGHSASLSVMASIHLGLYVYLIVDHFSLHISRGRDSIYFIYSTSPALGTVLAAWKTLN